MKQYNLNNMDQNELQRNIEDLQDKLQSLQDKFDVLDASYSKHQHLGTDGSVRYRIVQQPQQDIQIGCAFIDSIESVGSNSSLSPGLGGTPTDYLGYFVAGKENPETNNNFPSTQIILDYGASTNGSTNWSFLFGQRPPLFTGTSGVSSAGTLMTDMGQNWAVNSLAGAYVNFYDSSGNFQTRQIASNTANTLTLDTAWAITVASGFYAIWMPVFLGAADWPWRQGYFLGEDVSAAGDGSRARVLRFGFGQTSGPNVTGIYYGIGTPESAVTANVGSLYLRTNGGTSTTFYVKETGTGNTGWVAK